MRMPRALCFFSQHLLQTSIITSGLWLIRENLKDIFEESHCSPALLKLPFYSTDLVAVIFFFEKYCVKCTKVPAVILIFVGEYVKCTKVLAVTPFFVGEFDNLQR